MHTDGLRKGAPQCKAVAIQSEIMRPVTLISFQDQRFLISYYYSKYHITYFQGLFH